MMSPRTGGAPTSASTILSAKEPEPALGPDGALVAPAVLPLPRPPPPLTSARSMSLKTLEDPTDAIPLPSALAPEPVPPGDGALEPLDVLPLSPRFPPNA